MIIFNIQYETNWGDNLFICGNHDLIGNWDPNKALSLQYEGKSEWKAEVKLPYIENLEYKYLIRTQENAFIWEEGPNRKLEKFNSNNHCIRDFWQMGCLDSIFNLKPFKEVFFKRRKNKETPSKLDNGSFNLKVQVPRLAKNLKVAVSGNQKAFGSWRPDLFVEMNEGKDSCWNLEFDIQSIHFPIIYKYVIVDTETHKIIEWEEGKERRIDKTNEVKDTSFIQNDFTFKHDKSSWKAAGVAIPVFSLRTKKSFGVGEFSDLIPLADWAKKTGIKMIQVLPINETVATHSWLDSYPYKSISAFALHPMYLNLEKMGIEEMPKELKKYNKQREKLNKKNQVDYVEVTKLKSKYFKILFDRNWKELTQSKEYQTFYTENEFWLKPYAAFCYLRDWYKTSNFHEWDEWSTFNPERIEALTSANAHHYEHIAVHYFIQYHLDLQLNEAVEYTHKNGIALKGDIPIGISPNSIEAWTEPELFNLNGQAGAPPDDFAVLGQNWGFPTYNWQNMAKNDYKWWRNRLQMMSKYFDAYRIDHILGFFRIWEIPKHAIHGLQGYFRPGMPYSIDELEEMGIWFDTDRFTKPYIREHMLHDFFGENTDYVKKHFLHETAEFCYEVKDEFNTQQKIINHFSYSNENEIKQIREGLLSLLNEVIFIRDPYEKHLAYHPRITFHYTYSFRELDEELKDKLNRLYIDFFYQRHNEFWKSEALRKLPAITQASNMLVCGEDLGMVPNCVPDVMNKLSILSLEIQRMPKDPDRQFLHPNNAPYLSVCTTSTHDMSTIRGWWEEDREKTHRFYQSMLGHNNEVPYFAEPWVCKEIIVQHLHSPAMLTIFPIQDLLSMNGNIRWEKTEQERINVPSNPENRWCYRMNLSLEELQDADEFNNELLSLITKSGRNSNY